MRAMKAFSDWLTRQPLLIFFVLGGGIFLLNALVGSPEQERIVLGSDVAEDLVQMSSELLDRPLSPPEREAEIQRYVDQEILVREAVARGLHLKDSRVRKRLVDKMNFLLSEEPPEPTEADLQALYDRQPERYRTPETTSFEHIFFKRSKADAERLMEQIAAGEVPADDAGDKFWLGREMPFYAAAQLRVLFGYGFERALRPLAVGEWHGPIRSGPGWHLVRVQARHAPEDFPEEEVALRLRADWDAWYRENSREERLVELRTHYEVVLPAPAQGEPAE